MKVLQLTQQDKDHLLEMIKGLFPTLCSASGKCYCDEDQGAGYTYSDEHGDCDVCADTYPRIRDTWGDNLVYIEFADNVEIHWFEFCIKYLCLKLAKEHDTGDTDITEAELLRSLTCCFPNPIDYLYEKYLTYTAKENETK